MRPGTRGNRSSLISFALFLTIFAVARTADAQSAGTGAIEGRVTDPSGAAVAGCTVTVRSLTTGVSRSLTSDAKGIYRADLLQPDTYEITAALDNFATLRRSGVSVQVGAVATINLELQVAAITEVIQFRKVMARVHVKKRHRDVGWPERLFSKTQQADGILAAREHQRGPLKLRGDLTHDVDSLGFEVLQVVQVIRTHFLPMM